MEDYSKRPKFNRCQEGLQYCGDCVNFKPLWDGADRGTCLVKYNIVYLHFCCSFPGQFKPLVGSQLSLF